MGQNEGRTPGLLDDLGHGERLARAGHAEQHLVLFAVADAAHEFFNGRALVATGLVIHREMEAHNLSVGDRGRDFTPRGSGSAPRNQAAQPFESTFRSASAV